MTLSLKDPLLTLLRVILDELAEAAGAPCSLLPIRVAADQGVRSWSVGSTSPVDGTAGVASRNGVALYALLLAITESDPSSRSTMLLPSR